MPFSNSGFNLVGFLSDLGQYGVRIVPIKSDLGRGALQLQSAHQTWEPRRNRGEGTGTFGFEIFSSRSSTFGLLFGFDAFPIRIDLLNWKLAGFTKDMGMPAQHLGGDCLDYIAEIKRALLLRHARVEYDL